MPPQTSKLGVDGRFRPVSSDTMTEIMAVVAWFLDLLPGFKRSELEIRGRPFRVITLCDHGIVRPNQFNQLNQIRQPNIKVDDWTFELGLDSVHLIVSGSSYGFV